MEDKAYVWIGYSKNPPYLPVAVADTAKELARIMGVKKCTVISEWCHFRKGRRKVCRFHRVMVDGLEKGGDSRG